MLSRQHTPIDIIPRDIGHTLCGKAASRKQAYLLYMPVPVRAALQYRPLPYSLRQQMAGGFPAYPEFIYLPEGERNMSIVCIKDAIRIKCVTGGRKTACKFQWIILHGKRSAACASPFRDGIKSIELSCLFHQLVKAALFADSGVFQHKDTVIPPEDRRIQTMGNDDT